MYPRSDPCRYEGGSVPSSTSCKSRYEPGGSAPSSSSSSASCRSSSTLLPSSSSSPSSSSERYPTARTAAATGPDRSRASLATRYRAQSMRTSFHHSIISSCDRERKLQACWERRPMRSDPVLIDPAPSLRPSMWNLCDLAVELAAGPSVQSGRKREKSGEFTCAGSEELYSCRKPDGLRTK